MSTRLLGIAAAWSALALGGCAHHHSADHYAVKEVGSFHIGGRQVTLSGLPTKEIVFTAGAAPFKVDPNGDFEVEQMYVQYVKLHEMSRKGRYPMLSGTAAACRE